MHSTKLISAIIPTYNREKMIGRALESVFAQTHRPIEILIVDDGSTDRTEEAVAPFLERNDPGITLHYLRKENGGCSSARNWGILRAQGRYLAFLDSDDEWLPDALSNLLAHLGEADFVYSPSIEVFPDKEELNLPCAPGKPERFAVEHFKTTRARCGCLLYRQEIFARLGGFAETLRYNEDSDFLQRVAIAFKASYCPLPSQRVHHHGGNKSNQRPQIYRALLASARGILADYPDFEAKLGKIAEKRVREIQRRLVEALLLADQFEEARATAQQENVPLKWGMRGALLLNSKKFYELFSWL